MNDSKLYFKYKIGKQIYTEDLYQTQHYFIEDASGDNTLKLTINPREPLEVLGFYLEFKRTYEPALRFFGNGYQSWTTSKEYRYGDRQRGVTPITKLLPGTKELAAISSDEFFYKYPKEANVFHSHTYTYFRLGSEVELWGSLSEAQGFTIFEANMNNGTFIVKKDVDGLVIDKPYDILNVVRFVGNYDKVFDNYFGAMALPKPRIDHMAGYTSWYNYFTKITEDIIVRDLDGMDRANDVVSIFQIDDGYEANVGDWLTQKPEFPNGMKYLADKIHDKGYLAGIWLAPFNATRKSRIALEHPDWLIKYPNGKPVLGCAGWGGAYTLDLYNPQARAYIKEVFDVVLNEWGFDMVKLDFLYSQCMLARNGKTRGQIMCEAMAFLRECVGDKLILGCGVPLGAAFGYVDACRISCDMDLKYKPKYYNKLHVNNEVPSAQNAMTNTINRRHLDKRAFCNDPDVFFLRNDNLKYSEEQKVLLAKVNNMFGNVLFVSDNAGDYSDKQIEQLKTFFKKSNAIIISAEFVDDDNVSIFYLDDGSKNKLGFNIKTGHWSIIENL